MPRHTSFEGRSDAYANRSDEEGDTAVCTCRQQCGRKGLNTQIKSRDQSNSDSHMHTSEEDDEQQQAGRQRCISGDFERSGGGKR